MKKSDLNDLKTKGITDLEKKLAQLEKDKTNAQIELKMGKAKNVHFLKQIKRDIARVRTILTAKIFIQKTEEKRNATS